jgi:hypothetical protein
MLPERLGDPSMLPRPIGCHSFAICPCAPEPYSDSSSLWHCFHSAYIIIPSQFHASLHFSQGFSIPGSTLCFLVLLPRFLQHWINYGASMPPHHITHVLLPIKGSTHISLGMLLPVLLVMCMILHFSCGSSYVDPVDSPACI